MLKVSSMIELFEGVPGSGKSYYAVSERLLKWVRAGRRVYVYVDGFYLDRLAHFEGVALADLEKQITLWHSVEEVRSGLLTVEPGSAVFIDEVQTAFRSREKVDPEVLRWLETHRHRGVDVVLMCQQFGQLTLGVNRLIESTTKFRRLDRFGLKNRYQAQVRGNPEETEVIRMFTGKYSSKVYAYYSSYASGAIRETARGGSILKSPMIMIGLVGLVLSVWFFSSGKWLSAELPKGQAAIVLPPPPLPVDRRATLAVVELAPMVFPVRIQGGMTLERDGQEVWVWVAQDGRLMSEDEIAAESGGTVRSKMVRGVREISGTGVQYGGMAPERVQEVRPILPYVPPENPNQGPMPDVYTGPHPGLLATPPDLR